MNLWYGLFLVGLTIPLFKTLRNIENNTEKMEKYTSELVERARKLDVIISRVTNNIV